MTKVKRPFGIVVILVVHLGLGVLVACRTIAPTEPMLEEIKFGAKAELDPELALLGFVVACVWIETAFGLWHRRRWSWWVAVIFHALAVTLAVLVTVELIQKDINFGKNYARLEVEEVIFVLLPLLMHTGALICLFARSSRRYLGIRRPRMPFWRVREKELKTVRG